MKRERLSETSPAFRILSVEPRYGHRQGRPRQGNPRACRRHRYFPTQTPARSTETQNLPPCPPLLPLPWSGCTTAHLHPGPHPLPTQSVLPTAAKVQPVSQITDALRSEPCASHLTH